MLRSGSRRLERADKLSLWRDRAVTAILAFRMERVRLVPPGETRARGERARLYVRWMPHLGAEAKRVGQYLEDDVALRRPKAVVPQCRQTERVSGAVREIEPALQ